METPQAKGIITGYENKRLAVNHYYYDVSVVTDTYLFWCCVRSECGARLITDKSFNFIEHPDNHLFHNHPRKRTKMVKKLVLQEIEKFAALKPGRLTEWEMKSHGLSYLEQAFGTTLLPEELQAIRNEILSYQLPARLMYNPAVCSEGENIRLQICKAAKAEIQHCSIPGPSSDTSDSENDDVSSTSQLGNEPHYSLVHPPVMSHHSGTSFSNTYPAEMFGSPSHLNPPPQVKLSFKSDIKILGDDITCQPSTSKETDETEEDQNFLMSLLPLFKEVNPAEKNFLKLDILRSICDRRYTNDHDYL